MHTLRTPELDRNYKDILCAFYHKVDHTTDANGNKYCSRCHRYL